MKHGFKALTTSLRALFVILSIGLALSLFSLTSIATYGVPFLGIQMFGSSAVIVYAMLLLANAVLLYAMYNRENGQLNTLTRG